MAGRSAVDDPGGNHDLDVRVSGVGRHCWNVDIVTTRLPGVDFFWLLVITARPAMSSNNIDMASLNHSRWRVGP